MWAPWRGLGMIFIILRIILIIALSALALTVLGDSKVRMDQVQRVDTLVEVLHLSGAIPLGKALCMPLGI